MEKDNKLTELMENKTFEELTISEKSLVLHLITETEYNERHSSLLQMKKELKTEAKELKANENIRLAALQALRKKQDTKKPPIIPFLFSYKVPVWMTAAAILLIMLVFPSIFKTDVNKLQLAVRDTVYVDRIIKDTIKIIEASDPVIQTIYIKENTSTQANEPLKEKVQEENLKSINIRELEVEIAMNNYPSKIDFSVQPSGRSLSNDPLGKSVLNINK